jgi:hypothetical protein
MENKKEKATNAAGVPAVAQQFNLQVFENENQFENITAGLVKLEAGEQITGYLFKELEVMTDKEGETFSAVKIATVVKDFAGDLIPGDVCFIAGQVIVNAYDKIFSKTDKDFVPVKIVGGGEVTSARGRKYLDYKVFAFTK